jgi:hypothetical protein
MKKLICMVVLLIFVQNCWAIDINRFVSGTWTNPNQKGHGVTVLVLSENVTVIYWYVYHPDGTPTFLLGVGSNNNNVIQADVYYNSGMKFGDFNPADRMEVAWGTMKITVHSCGSATLEYDSDLEHNGVPYGSGSFPLSKVLVIDELQCGDTPEAGIYQGNFYSDAAGLVIPGVVVVTPDGKFAAVSFDNMAAIGTWSTNGSSLSGVGTAVSADPNFTFSSNLTLSGLISPEYSAVGTYSVNGGDYGSFEFFATPSLYRRGISLKAIAGNYNTVNLVTGEEGTASVSMNGTVNASDSFGCNYNGQFAVPDARFNLFSLTINVTSCGESNGEYTGYGIQIDYFNFGDGRILRLMGTNGSYAGVIDLYH